ncbi:MAG: hypothetical protein AAF483_11230 [Planctomycetota bacterium]
MDSDAARAESQGLVAYYNFDQPHDAPAIDAVEDFFPSLVRAALLASSN